MFIHLSLVEANDYTSESTWIGQVAEDNCLLLPIAKVRVEGTFGMLVIEAMVSKDLLEDFNFPYLLSNKFEKPLKATGSARR